jgi:hypothetical protein
VESESWEEPEESESWEEPEDSGMWTGEAGVDGVEGVVEPETAQLVFGRRTGGAEALFLRARFGAGAGAGAVDEARFGAGAGAEEEEEGFNGGARWTGRCCVTPAPERVLPEFRRVVGIWRAGWVLGWMKPRGWGIRLS